MLDLQVESSDLAGIPIFQGIDLEVEGAFSAWNLCNHQINQCLFFALVGRTNPSHRGRGIFGSPQKWSGAREFLFRKWIDHLDVDRTVILSHLGWCRKACPSDCETGSDCHG